jgi:hypothetical protein
MPKASFPSNLPLPKVDPDVFTVALVPLDNDESGQMKHDLVEGLREVPGIDVRVFSRPPISDVQSRPDTNWRRGICTNQARKSCSGEL